MCRFTGSLYVDNIVMSSFPICMPFISSSCPVALALTSSTVVNNSGDSKYSCFVPDLSRKTFSLSLFSMMLAVGFFVDVPYQVEEPSFYF